MEVEKDERPGVLNIGLARYSVPLGDTDRKKHASLAPIARLHVVAFATGLRGRRLREPAELTLLPLLPPAPLRFGLLLLVSLALGARLVASRRVSVVVSQSPYEGIIGVALGVLSRLLHRPLLVVTEVHGDWIEAPFLYQSIPAPSLVRPVLGAWARFTLRRSDRVRTISRYLENKVRAEAPGVPLHRFPTYTDFERFRSDHGERSRDPESLLSAGALYPVKGFPHLLRAMRRVVAERSGSRLFIAGDGPSRQSLEREARELGLGSAVCFLGVIDPEELRRRYLSASVFVLPSLSEGLGRVVWEAMACALPVVATNVGGIPDLVEDGVTGFLVEPEDEGALAEKILWLLEHPQEASRMGRTAREQIATRFSTELYVEGYRALFASSATD